MRGVPLTPAQVERAAEVYAQTGSYAEAGRAIGADETAVMRRLKRRREQDRAALHARALAKGLRKGRKALLADLALVDRYLGAQSGPDGKSVPAVEPRDLAELMKAKQGAVRVLASLQERAEDALEAPLRRRKLRAESGVDEKRADGTLPPERLDVRVQMTVEEAMQAISELERKARAT